MLDRPRRLGAGLRLAAVLPAVALAVAACGSGPIPGRPAGTTVAHPATGGGTSSCAASSAPAAVTIDATTALKFVPAAACLKAGGTVTWKNVGTLYHTTTDEASLAAVAADAALPTGATGWNHALTPGSSFSLKLTVAGLYKYFCVPHESLGMLGQITVVK